MSAALNAAVSAAVEVGGADLSRPALEIGRVLGASPGELAAEVAEQALSAAASALPAAGAAISGTLALVGGVAAAVVAIVSAVGWAEGTGPNQSERAVRVAWCRSSFVPARGSGPGLQVLPADLFVVESFDGFGNKRQPTLGRTLVHVFERESVSLVEQNRSQPAVRQVPFGNATGIDAKTAAALRGLREQIAALHRKADGGTALFLLYVDLLRVLRARSAWTPQLLRFLIATRESHPMAADVREDGELTCLDNDDRPLRAVIDLVDGWDQTVRNPYTSLELRRDTLQKLSRADDVPTKLLGK